MSNVKKKYKKELKMKFLEKIVEILKMFGGLHFAIKWNIGVACYVVYALLFGGSTLLNALLIIVVANLYTLPVYVVVLKGIGIQGDILLVVAIGALFLGYFVSYYITIFVWIIAMAFLFRQELTALIGMIKR